MTADVLLRVEPRLLLPRRAVLRSRVQPPGRGAEGEKEAPAFDELAQEEPVIVCRACRHGLTSPERAVAARGSHEHVQTNPHGVTFRFACYDEAPGCRVFGPPTDAYSWFPGFAWRFASCGGCDVHLGWHFTGAGEPFFGLIVDRLAHPGLH